MTFQLPDTISSPQDVTALTLEVQQYAKWYSQYNNASKRKVSYAEPQPEISPTASELIRAWGKQSPLTQSSLDDLIKELTKRVKNAPIMTITLAAPATSEVKKSLVAWARSNVNPDVLITFRFNSTLLGGMVVRVGSHVFDWSFRRVVMSERHRFREIMSRV
jgi:hypothetical protein